jgi:hypothetical protein
MLDEIKIAYLSTLVPVYLYRPLYGISISYLLLFLVSLPLQYEYLIFNGDAITPSLSLAMPDKISHQPALSPTRLKRAFYPFYLFNPIHERA